MKLLYALFATSLIVSQSRADLGSKLAAAQDQIEAIKNDVTSVESRCGSGRCTGFVAQLKCSGQACGQDKCGHGR